MGGSSWTQPPWGLQDLKSQKPKSIQSSSIKIQTKEITRQIDWIAILTFSGPLHQNFFKKEQFSISIGMF